MTAPSKAAIQREIRDLISRLRPGSVREPEPIEKIERYRDGVAQDPLVAAEEAVDMSRALADPSYYAANRDLVIKCRRLREQRAAEEQTAAAERRAMERQMAYREQQKVKATEEAARVQANEDAQQAAIDEQWSRPPGA